MQVTHEERVRGVADQLHGRPAGAKVTIRKGTPSHSIRDTGYKTGLHAVDVSALDQILAIDTARQVAVVEGQVTMGQLVAATLPQGWLPAVVPEFRQFTVAGLINGEGIQSSCHRHGIFTNTLASVELLMADGRTLTASPEHHAEVFAALPESLGTLGIVTAASLKLVAARPWVTCTYRRFDSRPAYVAAFGAALGKSDFHEGFIFGPNCYVLATAQFSDRDQALPAFDPGQEGGEYFYQHVLAAAVARVETREQIETSQYMRRLERGLWWMLECHADFPLLANTAWGRRQMDQAAQAAYSKTGFSSQAMTAAERDRCLVSQDMGVVLERLETALEWVQSRLDVYPLWNCAVRQAEPERRRLGTEYLVDVGIYGEPMAPGFRRIRDLRELQRSVPAPSLWGVSYLSWEEIRAVNPKRIDRYERVRTLVDADAAFLHLRDKVAWIDPAEADPGKIRAWRFYRSFGRRWYLNPVVYLLMPVVFLSKLIWRRPARHR